MVQLQEGVDMQTIPFSLERALKITCPEDPAVNFEGVKLRTGRLLDFEEIRCEFEIEPSQSLRWEANAREPSRVTSWRALSLRGPSYTVVDGGTSVMLTHVLRHSPVGLRWRNSFGESARLEPGAIFVSQCAQDSLVELVPASRDGVCECINVTLRADWPLDLSVLLDAHDFPFCNCSDACVRVMLGRYRDHIAQVSPLARLNVLDIDLVPFAEIEIPIAPQHCGLAVLTSGSLQFGGSLIEPLQAIAFRGAEPLARLATQTGASLLWFEVPMQSVAHQIGNPGHFEHGLAAQCLR
jgi:hypothetical protein